uniref:Uncharacterized protein n=1 Tax=Amorphochlora amoebiformis TaxID=1561963 RepID=A0A0H5BKJ5_9EUKA|nr:hypothetical protein [Amorphochlora amoebiformis]
MHFEFNKLAAALLYYWHFDKFPTRNAILRKSIKIKFHKFSAKHSMNNKDFSIFNSILKNKSYYYIYFFTKCVLLFFKNNDIYCNIIMSLKFNKDQYNTKRMKNYLRLINLLTKIIIKKTKIF